MIVRTSRQPAFRRREAFTLLEVLVVVAILVILAGVGSVVFMRYLEDAKADATVLKMQQLERACNNYAVKNEGNFPQSLQDLVTPADGAEPFVEVTAVTSTWGTPIQYNLEPGPTGSLQPVFRSQSADGKRLAVWPKWAQR